MTSLPIPDTTVVGVATRRLAVAMHVGLVVGGRTVLVDRDVIDVAVDPRSGRLAALTRDGEVHVRDDGHGWRDIASIDDGRLRVVAWHGDELLVGGAEARLWRVARDGGVDRLTEFDRAPTHADWHTPWGGPPDVFSIASDGDAYVNVHVGGILRSSDLLEWTPTIDLRTDVHDVTVDDEGTLWAATGMAGLARSTDRGTTWTHLTAGLHATYARAVAAVGGTVLVSVSSGPFGRDGAVYRLDGDALTRLADLPAIDGSVDRGRLVAGGDLAAIAMPSGDVVVSADEGRTWGTAISGCDDIRAVALRPSE